MLDGQGNSESVDLLSSLGALTAPKSSFAGTEQFLRARLSELIELNNLLLGLAGEVPTLEAQVQADRDGILVATARVQEVESRISDVSAQYITARKEVNRLDEQLKAQLSRAIFLEKERDAALSQAERSSVELAETRSELLYFRDIQELTQNTILSLERDMEEALAAWDAASLTAKAGQSEANSWLAECEALLTNVEAGRAREEALAASLADSVASGSALAEDRRAIQSQLLNEQSASANLLSHIQDLALNLEQARRESAQNTKEVSARDEQIQRLDDELKLRNEEAKYFRGRSEALEGHLENARAAAMEKAQELQARVDHESEAKVSIQKHLDDMTERFAKLVELDIARARTESAMLASAIDRVQAGSAWSVKRFASLLLRRS